MVLTVPMLERPATELGGEGLPLWLLLFVMVGMRFIWLCGMGGASVTFEDVALEWTEMGGVSRGL
jgi:hypothetical protein